MLSRCTYYSNSKDSCRKYLNMRLVDQRNVAELPISRTHLWLRSSSSSTTTNNQHVLPLRAWLHRHQFSNPWSVLLRAVMWLATSPPTRARPEARRLLKDTPCQKYSLLASTVQCNASLETTKACASYIITYFEIAVPSSPRMLDVPLAIPWTCKTIVSTLLPFERFRQRHLHLHSVLPCNMQWQWASSL